MVTDGSSLQVWHRRPVPVDAAVAAGLLAMDLVLAPYVGDPRSAVEAVLTALALAVVPLRHRLPVLALVLTTTGAAAVVLTRGPETFAVFAPMLALYVVALRSDRRSTLLAWVATAAVLASAAAMGSSPSERWEQTFSVLPWTALVAAVGNSVRSRRAYLAAVQERAARAERSREQEALRRVAQERVRIARDLHDVVAHHIAVVSVQAGAAQHLLPTDPAAAADALGHVRRAAADVLSELGDILTVLREPGEVDGSRAPAPGLARLEALLESFGVAGLSVDWSLHGQPRELPATVDLVAYRVLEEGLTNALKHGTGWAHVDVDHRPASLRLRVVNATPVPVAAGAHPRPAHDAHGTATGTGHGLLGMRERAAAVGGTVGAGAGPGDTFCVEADLPLEEPPP